jgi:Flp pilus assembly protein TadD
MSQLTLQQAIELAMQQQTAGRLAQAESIYRQILAVEPDQPEALHLLGVVALQAGRLDAARELIGKAIAVRPDVAEFHANLGLVLASLGQTGPAIESYRKALELTPNLPDALGNLGNALLAQGQVGPAIEALRKALALRPQFPEAQINLGNALARAGNEEEAIMLYRQALQARPDLPEASYNLGRSLRAMGELDEALAVVDRAVALQPRDADAHNNRGHILHDMGRLDDAVAAYRQAIALRPDHGLAHFNLGCVALLRGDFPRGWRELNWRWRVRELGLPMFTFAQPRWDGGELRGRRILLHCEQGFGDTIQFVRYAALVSARGGRVVLACQPELRRLLTGMPNVEQILTHGDPVPQFDTYCPLADLPMVFKTDLASIPATVPYLHADPDLSASWRERLKSLGTELKVGLVWSGRPEQRNNRNRALPLKALTPLGQIPGVRFFSFQFGPAAEQARQNLMELTDWTSDLHDFADTAALIDNLDLIITTDTSMAHLAGAMSKRVWVLLSFVPDWRWLLDRSDSPWYPTMRLFRQSKIGEWDAPVQQVVEALQSLPGL